MSLKNSSKKARLPWEIGKGEKGYMKEPYILKKGKDYITIEKSILERGNFYIQKNEEKRISVSQSQASITFYKLKDMGYKLTNKIKKIKWFKYFSLLKMA